MTKPTDDLIIWASSDVNLPNLAGPNKVKPIDDLILKGWDFKQKPAADEFNYLLNNLGQWINWAVTDIEAGTSLTASTLQTSRTINGTPFNGSSDITTSSWGTSRTLTLAGAVTGSVSIDGSGNVTLNTSVSPTSGVSILTGTVANGGTIPLPSGYSESQCKWFVSPNMMYVKNDNTIDIGQCWADANRVVNCQMTATDSGSLTGIANYIIIGIK